jgi:hypothetical protein
MSGGTFILWRESDRLREPNQADRGQRGRAGTSMRAVTVMRHSWIAVLGILSTLQGCAADSPAYTSDEEDAQVYADVVAVSRQELNVTGPMYVHPYLAVAVDDEGEPQVELSEFEYEPSAALELLRQRDSTVMLCQVDAQGMCAENYVVISQILRVGERDAFVVVRFIRGAGAVSGLIVKLRYGRGVWKVSASESIT